MAAEATSASYKIVAFVATAKPARARRFYRDTLGLRLVYEDEFALVFDAHATTLRVAIVKKVAAS
jgi:catechol 2,3-dioxygenase-like lactoylglutathione lyase family enzyme